MILEYNILTAKM